jgi:integrase
VDVTDVTCTDYMHARLRKVQGVTVRKELGALRRFLAWCKDRGHLPRAVVVPGVPTKTTGTKDARLTKAGAPVRHRQSAPELSPEHMQAFLAALPEWSNSKKLKVQFPIRARFIVQYETGLRPSTISALTVPEHYAPGATHLTITPEIDKVRWGRTVPLSHAARAALESVCPPKGGSLFGGHDYREHVAAAARASLPKALAAVFAGTHTRSARTTHLLEASGNLAGVQFIVGHKQGTTTAGYMRPSQRAAEAALGTAFGGQSPNTVDTSPRSKRARDSKKSRASG